MRRAGGILLALIALAAIGVGGFVAIDRFGGNDEPEPEAAPRLATVEVVRTDLVEEDTLDGTLRYGDPGTLLASGSGTITALPESGVVLGAATLRTNWTDTPSRSCSANGRRGALSAMALPTDPTSPNSSGISGLLDSTMTSQ